MAITRTVTTDERARTWFRRYWTFGLGYGAHVLVHGLLDLVQEEAERRRMTRRLSIRAADVQRLGRDQQVRWLTMSSTRWTCPPRRRSRRRSGSRTLAPASPRSVQSGFRHAATACGRGGTRIPVGAPKRGSWPPHWADHRANASQ